MYIVAATWYENPVLSILFSTVYECVLVQVVLSCTKYTSTCGGRNIVPIQTIVPYSSN